MGKNSGSRSPRTGRRVSILLAAPIVLAVGGCYVVPDIRTEQVLNRKGFGHRYTGDAAENYFIGIRDVLQIEDVYNPEIRGSSVVRMDGKVHLSLLGDVPVAGLTPEQLEEYLNQRFKDLFKEVDISVTVGTAASKFYYIFGQAAKGAKPFNGDLTLLDALLGAGGWNDQTANLGRIRVIRADPNHPHIMECNLRKLIQEGDSTDNIQIHEDDIIYVPPTILAGVGIYIAQLLKPFTVAIGSVLRTLLLLRFIAPEVFQFGTGGGFFGFGGLGGVGGGFGGGGGFVQAPDGSPGPQLGFGPSRLPRPPNDAIAEAGPVGPSSAGG